MIIHLNNLGCKRAIDGYDIHDVQYAMDKIELARDLFLSAVKSTLENNEHVEDLAGRRRFESFAAQVHDVTADELLGPLMKVRDEMEGNR